MSQEFVKCGDCMKGAPNRWCCKLVCGGRDACKDCKSEARGEGCPNDELYFAGDEKSESNTGG